MVTIKDVARLAGVSTATVSYALNGSGNISRETREKVLKLVKESNYQPNKLAKSLKINKTKTIGVIVEDITVFNAPEIINGIYEYAEKSGYTILLANLRIHKRIGLNYSEIAKHKNMIDDTMNELIGNQVEGIIYIGVHPRDVTGIIATGKPIVYTYCFTSDHAYSVNYDDEAAAYDATNYLIRQGHSRIGLISGPINSIPSHGRFNGYYKALQSSNLSFYPNYVKSGNWEYESGYLMAKELLGLTEKPTAILAMNDLMAGGILEACRELAIQVPADLSIVGFDNRECSLYYLPKLTTMALPLNEMGQKCMEIVDGLLLGHPHKERDVKLQCRLIARNSTSPIN